MPACRPVVMAVSPEAIVARRHARTRGDRRRRTRTVVVVGEHGSDSDGRTNGTHVRKEKRRLLSGRKTAFGLGSLNTAQARMQSPAPVLPRQDGRDHGRDFERAQVLGSRTASRCDVHREARGEGSCRIARCEQRQHLLRRDAEDAFVLWEMETPSHT